MPRNNSSQRRRRHKSTAPHKGGPADLYRRVSGKLDLDYLRKELKPVGKR